MGVSRMKYINFTTKSEARSFGIESFSSRTIQNRVRVEMGTGLLPPRIVQHGTKVEMGTGALPPRIIRHGTKVEIGTGALPPRIIRHR